MFVSPTRRLVAPDALKALGERVRPISSARTRRLPVTPSLLRLLPTGLQRGTSVGVTADSAGGATTLALSLLAGPSRSGSWSAVVGLPDLGARAAEEAGVDLDRLVCIPTPGVQWAETVARLIEGIDVILLRAPRHVRPALARRLVARVRDRGAVLLVLDQGGTWPESCDVELRVTGARWVGVGRGEDCLRRRLADVTIGGRRHGGRREPTRLWLPDDPTPLPEA